KTYSLSYIRNKAQSLSHFNEGPCTGINYQEVLNALKLLGVDHYRVAWNVNASFVAKKTAIGPVMTGIYYGAYPNWKGHCGPIKAEIAGRTQCNFSGSHMVLALKKVYHVDHTDMFVRDPDH